MQFEFLAIVKGKAIKQWYVLYVLLCSYGQCQHNENAMVVQ